MSWLACFCSTLAYFHVPVEEFCFDSACWPDIKKQKDPVLLIFILSYLNHFTEVNVQVICFLKVFECKWH